MRILHVSDTSIYNYDGIATYINELLECACLDGEKPLALVPPPLYADVRRGVRHTAHVKVFPNVDLLSSDKFVFAVPLGMEKMILDYQPDLVWIHTIGPLGLAAARFCKDRFRSVYTKHCFDGDLWCNHLQINRRFHWFFHLIAEVIEKWVVKNVDVAFYHFEGTEKIRLPQLLHKFKFSPPPINRRFIMESPRHNAWCDRSKLTIGFCGRLDPEKGLEDIFAAIALYRKNYVGRQLRLLLIGDGPMGRSLAEKYPEIDVTITGFVDDVITHLDTMDAFVLASKTETTSLSSLEAYARNLPIFSRPVGFLGLNSKKYRHVYNFDTPAELAALIYQVMEVPREPSPSIPSALDPSLISFSQLYARVEEEYS